MGPPSANVGDVSFMGTTAGAVALPVVLPPEQAMAVASSPRASLLSTWPVLVQEEGGGRRTCEGVGSRERRERRERRRRGRAAGCLGPGHTPQRRTANG